MRLLFIYMTEKLEQLILEILSNRKDYITYFKNNRTNLLDELRNIKEQLKNEI